jgi:ribonuclease D
MAALAAEHDLPVENVLTPDYLRRTLWQPPATRDPGELLDAIVAQLSGYGARSWQIALAAPLLTTAVLDADARPEPDAGPDQPREPGQPEA